MRRTFLTITVSLGVLAVTACSAEKATSDTAMSEAVATEGLATDAVVGEAAAGATESDMAAIAGRSAIPVSLPKMAYAYRYGFRLPAEGIAPLQQRHADLCEAKGPSICQIVSLSQSGETDERARGELSLQVATGQARAFGFELSGAAAAADAEQVNSAIEGADLSKQMVDTEASLRSREALRHRLLEVLETRRGKVSELVEAERSVAQVNAEIDQARSWLAEMRGRVAYSRVTVNYEAAEAGSFLTPIRNAFGALGSILGNLMAVLLVLGAVALPLVLTALGVRQARRRLGWAGPRVEA